MRRTALLLLLALAACDAQGPTRSNPYDPGFDGDPAAAAPTSLALAASTPSSVTLSWTDRSGDSGMRVELLQPNGRFDTVADVPSGVTTFTDSGLTGTATRRYRVVALAADGRMSAPSEPLDVRFPLDTLRLPGIDPSQSTIGPEGDRLYTVTPGGTLVTDLRTGARLATIPSTGTIAGFLAGGRVILTETSTVPFAFGLRVFDGEVPNESWTLSFGQGGCQGSGFFDARRGIRVSAAGRRAATLCGFEVLVWNLGTAAPAYRYGFSGVTNTLSLDLSEDGSRIVASLYESDGLRAQALDAATGARLWSVSDIRIGESPFQGIAVADDIVAFAVSGRLRVVDARTGAVRAETLVNPIDAVVAVSSALVVTNGYDFASASIQTRVYRTEDLSLVRSLRQSRLATVRVTSVGLVSVGRGPGGETVAVRLDLGASWEAVR